MLFKALDDTEAKKFGLFLATFYIEKEKEHSQQRKKSSAKKKRGVDLDAKVATHIAQFKQQNTLNIYKKAKLGNVFKWTLLEAGYDKEDVNELTHQIMLKF